MNEVMQLHKIDDTKSEILIYGEIRKKSFWEYYLGDEKSDPTRTGAYEFSDMLKSVETPNLTVRINSMGGSVSEGLSIYNLLSEFDGELTTIVDGFACSAASVIFMAGKKRIVPESALLMIHNAWSYASGDSNAMRKAAEDLEKITQPSVNIYVTKTGLEESVVKEMMDKESWITSNEAYDLGFATTLEKNEAQQSLSDQYLRKLIMENKELQKVVKQQVTSEQKNEDEETSNWSGFF